MAAVLELRGITKAFPGVLANDHIDLTLEKGEILALLGENGAGKTTLMNILYGLYAPDAGEIFVNGKKAEIHEPTDAIELGIGMVHQHFMLVPVFTVTENVMLGVEPTHYRVWLDRKKVAASIREISDQYKLEVDPGSLVKNIAVGVQQRVEIIKVLYRKADILILDEPTAVLTPQEVDELFKIIRSLSEQGKSIIFITHKLKEVMALSDRITVLRGGRVVGTTTPKQATMEQLAQMMVGREVDLTVEKAPANATDVVLKVENLHVLDARGDPAVQGVSFEVRKGEVLGVAGVHGNGQTELVRALTGLLPIEDGQVWIAGKQVTKASPRHILEQGVAHVPEDRQQDGLVLSFPVHDNLVLSTYYLPPFAKGLNLHAGEIAEAAAERAYQFDIRTPNVFVPVSTLSGGNQQKVIVAREFSRPIHLLIASQPTRGLDVGSIEYIHQRILEKREEGCAVLLVSAELDEILALSDRIAVIYDGRFAAVLPAAEASRQRLGLLMAGVRPEDIPQEVLAAEAEENPAL